MEFNRVFDVFDQITKAQGTNAKIALFEEAWGESRATVEAILKATHDPYVNYYITAAAVPSGLFDDATRPEMTDEELTVVWEHFEKMLRLLNTRTLSGNNAKDQVAGFLNMLSPRANRYFTGILNRDLKIGGINITTFKRYIPTLVPSISPALCKDHKAGFAIPMPCIVEPKWDGVRAVIIINEQGIPTALSRNGLGFNNWDHIRDVIMNSGLKSIVIDGEFMADDFSKTTSIVSTKGKHPNASTLKFYVFDALPLAHWDGKTSVPIEARKNMVSLIVETMDVLAKGMFVATEWTVCETLEAVMGVYHDCVAKGLEGIIAKKPGTKYPYKRSADWIKLKPDTTADLTVIDAEIGKADGKFRNSLGAFVLQGDVEWEGKLYENVQVNVGSGLTEADSVKYWTMHQEGDLVGKTVEIKFDRVSADSEGKFSLRFPRFVCVRFDK